MPTVAEGLIMSADNGVYVLKTKGPSLENPIIQVNNGTEGSMYRVAVASAIGNLDYYMERDMGNLDTYVEDVWGRSKVFTSLPDALVFAHSVAKDHQTEYGVSVIDMNDYVFCTDR